MKTRNIINPLRQIFDSDRLAEVASTLAGNKSRTMLTAFGIFWGVFMLILLLGGGKGLQDLMMSKFGGFAENTGAIASKNTTKAYKGYSKGREWSLNMRDVENLHKNIKGIDVIVPMIVEWGKTAKCSKRTYSVQALKGIHPDQLKIETSELKYGRYINANDVRQERKVCVIGKRVFEELFPDGKNPCGKFINIDGVYYEVIGMDVRTSNISISGQSQESILIPYTVMRNILNYGEKVDIVTFTAQKNTTVASLGNSVRRVLYRAHNIHPDDKEALEYFNAETVFQMFNNLFRGINILVWLIGIGTVVSGVIGVTNIMLVSIRERTVELGIRRAIGAKPRDILVQILTESEIMTLMAGMSGLIAAVAILGVFESLIRRGSQTLANFQIPFSIAFCVALALLVLGLVAGIFPAARALAIKPVDAMRDE